MKKGFTLIELLVVVLIISILAAVALPQYQKAVAKTHVAQLLVHLHALEQAQRAYFLANGEYVTDRTKLDIGIAKDCYASGEDLVYCTFGYGQKIGFEWNGHNSTGKTRWVCLTVEPSDTISNEICKQYAQKWGGSGEVIAKGTINYYAGAWQ